MKRHAKVDISQEECSAGFPACRIAGLLTRERNVPVDTLPTRKSAIQQARKPALHVQSAAASRYL
jgi:hypothetical protein